MDKKIKKKWIEALRSGKYKQAMSQLRMDDAFCCLGVLCDIVKPEAWQDDTFVYSNKEVDVFLPWKLGHELDIDRATINTLSRMNDMGDSFEKIAKYIEETIP